MPDVCFVFGMHVCDVVVVLLLFVAADRALICYVSSCGRVLLVLRCCCVAWVLLVVRCVGLFVMFGGRCLWLRLCVDEFVCNACCVVQCDALRFVAFRFGQCCFRCWVVVAMCGMYDLLWPVVVVCDYISAVLLVLHCAVMCLVRCLLWRCVVMRFVCAAAMCVSS